MMNMMMKHTLALAVGMIVFLTSPAIAQQTPNAPGPDTQEYARMGTYIAVDDVQTSAAFYERLFGYGPMIALENFVAFDVAGGTFAIASKAAYAPDAAVGSGSVPYIQVTDITALRESLQDRLDQKLPAIIDEPGIKLLKLTDPQGQLIEFFELLQKE